MGVDAFLEIFERLQGMMLGLRGSCELDEEGFRMYYFKGRGEGFTMEDRARGRDR